MFNFRLFVWARLTTRRSHIRLADGFFNGRKSPKVGPRANKPTTLEFLKKVSEKKKAIE